METYVHCSRYLKIQRVLVKFLYYIVFLETKRQITLRQLLFDHFRVMWPLRKPLRNVKIRTTTSSPNICSCPQNYACTKRLARFSMLNAFLIVLSSAAKWIIINRLYWHCSVNGFAFFWELMLQKFFHCIKATNCKFTYECLWTLSFTLE